MLEANLAQHKYMLAMPCYDSKVTTLTASALLSSCMNMSKMGFDYTVTMLNSGTLIDASRNEIAEAFMASDCDTLVCLDSDMTWKWEDMLNLLVYSHHYPVVAGAYTAKADPPKFYVRFVEETPNEHGLFQIEHIGFGFVAIQKNVFEKLKPFADRYTNKTHKKEYIAYHKLLIEDGEYIGEDVYFFKLLKKAGIPAYVIPNINLGHVGMKEYNTPFSTVFK